jgi:hypothetical protein
MLTDSLMHDQNTMAIEEVCFNMCYKLYIHRCPYFTVFFSMLSIFSNYAMLCSIFIFFQVTIGAQLSL